MAALLSGWFRLGRVHREVEEATSSVFIFRHHKEFSTGFRFVLRVDLIFQNGAATGAEYG